MKSRAFVVGGFGASEEMLQPVGKALEKHFDEVDVMSLRYAEGSPDTVEFMAEGVDVFALSAGIGPVANTRPSALHGLGAALPSSRPALLFRTAIKQWRMHKDDPEKAQEFERLARSEILADPGFHLEELSRVRKMDALDIAAYHQKNGRPATLAFFEDDAYFRLRKRDIPWVNNSNLNILHLPGQHDEPILNPQFTIDNYLLAARQ